MTISVFTCRPIYVKLILFMASMGSLATFGNGLSQTPQRNHDNNTSLSFSSVRSGEHTIHYAKSGDSAKPGILFIHGTPGGWGAFRSYLESTQLQQDFFLVSVDRLGWGKSTLAGKEINGDFSKQSRAIGAVLEQYPTKKWTLVGHSLGASLAPQVALDYSSRVQSMLLLAGSLKPSLGSPRWYNYAASTWVIANLIGKSMKYSNREIMALKKQLKQLDTRIKKSKSTSNVIIMQGQKDRLVSPKNPAYALAEWSPHFASIKLIELENEGHFLPWRQSSLVIQSIYALSRLRDSNK
ncbi:hypothetical protein NBRC116583_10120 [Arenicella sp. 4NH20-0111]|uniref:alpha/beta fold hydrolase n=1 Tax=Arenicella sp. 4NH20-0111 TaxID=3127648 RepID=UPI0031099B89